MFQRRVSSSQRKLPANASELLEARFRRFLRDFKSYERQLAFQQTMDSFLDLYSDWKKKHEPLTKLRLVMLAFELHRLDKGFQCDLSFEEEEGSCAKSSCVI